MPSNNHTRSLVLYVAIEAVGWVTVAFGLLTAAAALFAGATTESVLPFNIGAATPGVTLAVAGLFAAGLAHHGRITLDMARSLRHLVHLAATTAGAQPSVQPVAPELQVAPPEPAPRPAPTEPKLPAPQLEAEPEPELEPEPDLILDPEPRPQPTLPPAPPIIPPLPPLPPLEPEPVRTPPTPLFAAPTPEPESESAADEPTPADAGEPEQVEIPQSGESDMVVYRNVQIELRADGIFIRDRKFGSVDEARAFIDRVLDRAPR